MQQLMQTAANLEKSGSSAAKIEGDDTNPDDDQTSAAPSSPGPDGAPTPLNTIKDSACVSHDRDIQKQSESIRTLPGLLDVNRMKWASTDYSRCSICNLQGVA